MFTWAQEVIVDAPEGNHSSVNVIKAVRVAVGGLIGAVEPFDHLLERANSLETVSPLVSPTICVMQRGDRCCIRWR